MSSKQIIGHGNKGIFLNERLAVLTDECKSVHVRIDTYSKVGLVFHDSAAEPLKIFRKGFGIVSEIASRLTVQANAPDAQALEQTWHDDTSDAVHRIQYYSKACRPHSGTVDVFKCEDGINMFIGKIMAFNLAQFIHRGEVKITVVRKVQDCLPLCGGQELPFLIEKFQGVPLLRVMRSGYDNSSVSLCELDGKFRCRSRSETAFYYVNATADQSTADKLLDHLPAQAGLTADHHFIFLSVRPFPVFQAGTICISELYYVNGGKPLSGRAAYGSAYSGYGFYQCHGSGIIVIS